MFKLRIGWIDTSYWDDGSRYTTTTKDFNDLEEVNTFVEKHLQEPYTFTGEMGLVTSTLDPESLQLIEVKTTQHDIYTLPALQEKGVAKYRAELRKIAKWGGDLKGVEERVRLSLGWERADFLREWEAALRDVL